MSSGQLRVSDADRDRVTELLHTAYADGRISVPSTPNAPRRPSRPKRSTTSPS